MSEENQPEDQLQQPTEPEPLPQQPIQQQLQHYQPQKRPYTHPPISFTFHIAIELITLISSIPYILDNSSQIGKIITGITAFTFSIAAIFSHFPIPKLYTFLHTHVAFLQQKTYQPMFFFFLSGSMLPTENQDIFSSIFTVFARFLPILVISLSVIMILIGFSY